ncbi:hypothetical protein THRCLA_22139 [Thraustotheca clavata]|uniref:Secreted protein n=1 Tax=Thraustotheca clavata TaxID=74557 RepID=A0A1V9ZBT1_9STRA|nr:hypothetical protein THRCLA_22139 [Thraustotheca clavata]
MKLIYLTALLAVANAQLTANCNEEVHRAYFKCSQFVPPGRSPSEVVHILKSSGAHLSICFGDWPECDDLQNIGLSPAGAAPLTTYEIIYLFAHAQIHCHLLSYNQTSQNLIVKSNGQCLEAVPNQAPSFGFGIVETALCNLKSSMQQWTLDGDRVHTEVVSVSPCDDHKPYISNHTFTDCNSVTTNYVRIVPTHGKRVSEYYSGLYFNNPANNFNELFT